MNRFQNRKSFLLMLCLAISFTFMLSAHAEASNVYHRLFMKGSIIEKSGSEVYLCIGTNDGASVGQELEVFKVSMTGQPKSPSFSRKLTGKIKITQIYDEHFAKADVISGSAEKNDVVELMSH